MEEKGFKFFYESYKQKEQKVMNQRSNKQLRNYQKEYVDQQVDYSTELHPDDKKPVIKCQARRI